jgi:4-hydroxyphenylacetate 3-hydroxylase, reductase component
VVATARTQTGALIGMTMSSFNTVSLDPPLVLFSVNRRANSFEAWQSIGRYAVNVLSEDQEQISNQFARASDNKWEGLRMIAG